jgi:hypothetical protein
MARKIKVFSMSFLDVLCCGLGAVILLNLLTILSARRSAAESLDYTYVIVDADIWICVDGLFGKEERRKAIASVRIETAWKSEKDKVLSWQELAGKLTQSEAKETRQYFDAADTVQTDGSLDANEVTDFVNAVTQSAPDLDRVYVSMVLHHLPLSRVELAPQHRLVDAQWEKKRTSYRVGRFSESPPSPLDNIESSVSTPSWDDLIVFNDKIYVHFDLHAWGVRMPVGHYSVQLRDDDSTDAHDIDSDNLKEVMSAKNWLVRLEMQGSGVARHVIAQNAPEMPEATTTTDEVTLSKEQLKAVNKWAKTPPSERKQKALRKFRRAHVPTIFSPELISDFDADDQLTHHWPDPTGAKLTKAPATRFCVGECNKVVTGFFEVTGGAIPDDFPTVLPAKFDQATRAQCFLIDDSGSRYLPTISVTTRR